MKRKKSVAKADKPRRAKGERYQSLKSKILILLQERNDLTRYKLAEILQKKLGSIDCALTSLRKAGFKVFPSKGPGSPLRIAVNEKDGMRFINYRRRLFLPTATRMIIAEYELAEQFTALSETPKKLLLELNNATKQHGTEIRNGSTK